METNWRINGGAKQLATLNVKNMPDALYRRLQARARRQRRSVAQEVTQIISAALEAPAPSPHAEWVVSRESEFVARERPPAHRGRTLSDIAGTWQADPLVDEALAAQDRVDADLWK
jgi:plasmid stability protein